MRVSCRDSLAALVYRGRTPGWTGILDWLTEIWQRRGPAGPPCEYGNPTAQPSVPFHHSNQSPFTKLVFGIGLVHGYGTSTHASGWIIQPCLPNMDKKPVPSYGWIIQPWLPIKDRKPVPSRERCRSDGTWHQSATPRCDSCARFLAEPPSHFGIPVPESWMAIQDGLVSRFTMLNSCTTLVHLHHMHVGVP